MLFNLDVRASLILDLFRLLSLVVVGHIVRVFLLHLLSQLFVIRHFVVILFVDAMRSRRSDSDPS